MIYAPNGLQFRARLVKGVLSMQTKSDVAAGLFTGHQGFR